MKMNVMLKWLFFCCQVVYFTSVEAQDNSPTFFNKQLSYTFENDFFSFRGTDGYYTNGIFLNYSYLQKARKNRVEKTINTFSVGQKIFTQGYREVYVRTELDRPITGYLFGEFTQTSFRTNNSFYKWGINVATIGPAALAKNVLNKIHPILKINASWWEWAFDYELKNEPGLNVVGSYGLNLLKYNPGIGVQVSPVTSLSAGNTYTYISQAVAFQFGRQNKMSESSFWQARLQNSAPTSGQKKHEIFAYVQPQLMLQVYNATVQGGLFRSDKGRLVSKLTPLVYSQKMGLGFSTPRLSAGFHLVYQTREARLQYDTHWWGGFNVDYRFR